tara:strand:- start:62 stop:1297 length:1236 start_codon:yes stop_codon:yes gene_type:complete
MFKKPIHDNTAESCIEILSGVHPEHPYDGKDVNNNDKHLILSLTKQTFRDIAYTDRQYELVKTKLELYKSVLENLGIDVVSCINNLRYELRSIDRSRWIGFRENKNQLYLAVRFSFNKKLINVIDQIRSTENKKLYDEEQKIHYFPPTEKNLYKIVTLLKDKNFTIEEEITKQFETVQSIMNNKKNYIPGVYSFQLKNLNQKAIDYMITDIGEHPSPNNLALYKDRNALYGIEHFDEDDLDASVNGLTTLSQKIVRRTNTQVLINSKTFTIDNVAESILELNRYPVLVCLNNDDDLDDLAMVHNTFRNIFSAEDSCVLYRKDNDSQDNKDFNQYIKQNSLNNSLGNMSKLVYTKQDKLIKTLMKSDWRPKSAIVFKCSRNNKLQTFLDELDLVMYYDTDVSPFLQHKIEKL